MLRSPIFDMLNFLLINEPNSSKLLAVYCFMCVCISAD